jgi:tetratricopeptide (TPR) repeat protein
MEKIIANRFTINDTEKDLLGRGGMGEVYRATDTQTGETVAVKALDPEILRRDSSLLERFLRESGALRQLNHPNIVHMVSAVEEQGRHYIAMEFVEGGSLRDILASRGSLPASEVVKIALEVADALARAHHLKIIHRDLKPANILIARDGTPRLADFGIAHIQGSSHLTQSGILMGTVDYLSPEMCQGDPPNELSDIWAFGVMLFEMLSGKLPFEGKSMTAKLTSILSQSVPDLTQLAPDTPDALADLIYRMLKKNPQERIPSVRMVGAELEAMLKGREPITPALGHGVQATVAGLNRTDIQSAPDPKPAPSEQNKIVTVLFASALDYEEVVTAAKGTEAAQHALQILHERVEKIIAAREGQLVNQGEHDWLALWGATVTNEDNAERAVRTALDMQAAVRELGAGVFTESETEPLPLKIGVHSGMTLLTPGDKKDTFTASGTAITLAQRLTEAADGSILISPDTFRAVQGVFDLREDLPLKVRGHKEPLPTYRVIAAKPRAFRVRIYAVAGVEIKMVGREAEFKQLQNAYLNAYEENETQVVTVLSESGLGKSRLLNEFDQWYDLRPEDIRVFQGYATPAMTLRPYALWRDLLSFRFEILDDDPLPLVRQKMENGITELLGKPDTEMAHLMGYLAGFDFADSPHIKGLLGDPKQLTARARQLAFRFFERLGKIQPAIIELEDVHYADDASLDLFNELPVEQPALPLTIIYLARPALLERRPAWGSAQGFHKRLTLEPLDKRESRDLARDLLQKIPEPPKALRDLLVERAEGNPLFMEELVRLLLEDRVIMTEGDGWSVEEARLADLRVPPSLMGVLQTRLDTLPYNEKLTLQRAAAFGRVFHDTFLRAVDAVDVTHVRDLPAALKTLEARGFIQRRETSAFAGSLEYAFAQGMLRDMLYVTLVERQRRAYHAASAAWLARTERAEELLPLIAEHYEKAADNAHAAGHFERAGDKVMRVSGFADAVQFYTRAQSLVANPSSSLTLKLAEAHQRLGDFPAARTATEAARAAATTEADRAAALALLGEMTSELGEYAEAQKILTEAVPMARDSGNQTALCRALYALGDVNWRLGKLDEARVALNESLALARELGDLTRELFALNRLGVVYIHDDIAQTERFLMEVHTRAVAAGNRERAMTALNNLGVVAYERRDYVAAREYGQQVLVLARETGVQDMVAMGLVNLAESDTKLGNLSAARAGLREGLAYALRLGAPPLVVAAVTCFATLAYAEGQIERALALYGLAQRQPAWSSDNQHGLDVELAQWALDPAVVEAGMARGAELDWDATIQELLKE